MSAKQHVVVLTAEQRADIGALLTRNAATAIEQRHGRILLHADAGPTGPKRTDVEVAAAVGVDARTVARTRAVFVQEGFAIALHGHPRQSQTRSKLDSAQEARLVAVACSTPPAGHARWTLRLLANRLVELQIVDGISPETVRQTLKKTNSSPGWCGAG